MTENATPSSGQSAPAGSPEGIHESQWALVAREFKKRRLAVISLCVIILLATISVFAPFLANDRPLAYRGYNRFDYSESARTIRSQLNELRDSDGQSSQDSSRIVGVIDLHLRAMTRQVDDTTSGQLQVFRNAIREALEQPDQATRTTAFNDLRRQLRSELGPNEVNFVRSWHFPVLASLTRWDAGFMLLNALLISLPLWSRCLKRIVRGPEPLRGRQRTTIAVFFTIPLLGATAWHWIVPQRVDRTPYKQAAELSATSDGSDSAPMMYESIIWPAVPYGLDEDNLDLKYLPPVWWESSPNIGESTTTAIIDAEAQRNPHWLGTDGIGRDTLCRMIWGGRVSLAVGIVAVSIYVTIGIIVGSIAGYFRGITDLIISRLIEVVICFPSFFLILTIVAFIGPSIFNIMVVIGLIGWTGIARLVRGEFLRLGEQDFVSAGRALGYKAPRIIFQHVLPNALAPVLVAATFGVAGAILTESALSFLGFGITVPKPSWGGILADGRGAIFRAPWLIYFPGFAIFMTITCYNLVGEAFRDAADPRLRDGHS